MIRRAYVGRQLEMQDRYGRVRLTLVELDAFRRHMRRRQRARLAVWFIGATLAGYGIGSLVAWIWGWV